MCKKYIAELISIDKIDDEDIEQYKFYVGKTLIVEEFTFDSYICNDYNKTMLFWDKQLLIKRELKGENK